MEQNQYVEYLLHFGLTRQEALIYVELLVKGKQTGYEIAKETGISRSNVYSVLAALAEKGRIIGHIIIEVGYICIGDSCQTLEFVYFIFGNQT